MARRRNSQRRGAKKQAKKAPLKEKPVKISKGIPAICSECFGDFLISTTTTKERISCPNCGHVGIIEEGAFEDIERRRANHKKAFLTALIVNGLAVILILLWGLFNSWPLAAKLLPGGQIRWSFPGDTLNLILLGGGLIALILGFIFVSRYEKSRVEVYF